MHLTKTRQIIRYRATVLIQTFRKFKTQSNANINFLGMWKDHTHQAKGLWQILILLWNISFLEFYIANVPFLSSSIPSSHAYCVLSHTYTGSQGLLLLWMFYSKGSAIPSQLLGQGYVKERLKSSFVKFYGRYGNIMKFYEVSLSQMLHDILGHDHIQWHPRLIRIFKRDYY